MSAPSQSSESFSPQLAELKRQLEDIVQNARLLVAGLTVDQMKHRSKPETWSIAECLEHLNLTSRAFLPILKNAVEEANQKQIMGDGRYKMDFWGRMLKWILEPPARMRVKTSAPFQPIKVDPVERVLPTFLELQTQVITSLSQANGLALSKIKISSPFDARVKYNLFSAFNLIAAHERRHLWQAEQVKKALLGH